MEVEVARQQWRDGNRRLEEARANRDAYARLLAQVEVLVAELRRRVGQTFTLAELTNEYARSDDWARDVLDDARPEDGPPPETATATDAAFHLYARGATDYAP